MSEEIRNLIDSRTCHQCGKEMSVLWPHLWRYKRRNPHTGKSWYFCSWKCLREFDNKRTTKGDITMDKVTRLTDAQKAQAVQICLEGGNPLKFLADLGCKNTTTAWTTVRHWAEKNCEAGVYGSLPEKFGQPKKKQAVIAGMTAEEAAELVKEGEKLICQQETNAEPEQAEEEPAEEKVTISAAEVKEAVNTFLFPLKEPTVKPRITAPVAYEEFTVREVEGLFGRYRRSDIGAATYIDFENADGISDVVSYTVDQWKSFVKELKRAAAVLGVDLDE